MEDRASGEIDRARQEAKAMTQRFEVAQRDHDKAVKQLAAERDRHLSSLRAVEQQLATELGRAAALQQRLIENSRPATLSGGR